MTGDIADFKPKTGNPINEQEAVDWSDYWFESGSKRRFWVPHPSGRDKYGYVDLDSTSMKNFLFTRGATRKKGDNQLSEVDDILQKIMLFNRVEYAGMIAGWNSGRYYMSGNPILVTRPLPLIPPINPHKVEELKKLSDEISRIDPDIRQECVGWPVIGQMIKNLLSFPEGDDSDPQRPRFYLYCKLLMEALYSDPPKVDAKAPVLVIAGEAESGKSRILALLVEMCGHRKAYPYRYLIGRDSHNSELAESVILAIDDENSQKGRDAREEFKAGMKQIVAGDGYKSRAMGVAGKTLFPLWRLVVLLNEEPDDLRILPPIDDGFADKILLFKGHKGQGFDTQNPMPMPTRTQAQREVFWERVRYEVPHFIWWLLNEHEPEPAYYGRFGVKAYHHPELMSELNDMSKEYRLLEFIDRVIFRKHGETHWSGSVEDLKARLLAESEQSIYPKERDEISTWQNNYLGRMLKKLGSESMLGDHRVWQERGSSHGRQRTWHVLADGHHRSNHDKAYAKKAQTTFENDSNEEENDSKF